jgi:hypothetical protein
MPSLNTGNAILSNAIAVDSSYNVGIGGAASGSFKLQVTGTSNLTGTVTLATTSGVLAINTTGRPAGVGGGDNGKVWSKQATSGNYGIATIASATDSFTYIGHNGTDALLGTSYGTTGAYTDLVIQTADVTRFRLSGSTGAATFSNTGSASYGLTIANSSDNLRLRLGTTTGGYLNIQGQITSSGNPFNMSLQADGGNVGIGTSTINASSGYTMLRINGGSGSEFSLAQGGTDYAYMYANSGIFAIATQAAIPLTFQTNATERMRISSLGALTYNTTDAQGWFAGFSVSGTNFAYMGSTSQFANSGGTSTDFGIRSANAMAFYTSGGNERMRITSGGAVCVGMTSSAYSIVAIKSNTTTPYGGFNVYANGNGNFVFMNHDNNVGWIGTEFGAGGTGFTPLAFSVGGGQRMTILTDGKTGIGKTAQITGLDVYQSGTDVINARTDAAAGNARSLFTGWNTASATTSGNFCFNVTSNGNVTNSNNSYGPISDLKLKENIIDASPKLDDLMKVRIVNYNLKAELGYESYKQIGVIAQELEQVFPGLVDEFNDRDVNGNELGTTTKSVKMSVFVPMLIKAIQELNQKVNEQQQTINSLINR